jgi:hypothetical protein
LARGSVWHMKAYIDITTHTRSARQLLLDYARSLVKDQLFVPVYAFHHNITFSSRYFHVSWQRHLGPMFLLCWEVV